MGKSKKKEKYVPLTGLTGIGEDYNIYIMDPREKIIGYLIGFAAGFLAAQIMFGVVIASIVIGAAVGFYAIPVYRRYLQERRRKAILLQFRDMLDSLSNSFSAGKNTPDAFTDAYSDLKLAYGEQAPIVKEMAIIVSGLRHDNGELGAFLDLIKMGGASIPVRSMVTPTSKGWTLANLLLELNTEHETVQGGNA